MVNTLRDAGSELAGRKEYAYDNLEQLTKGEKAALTRAYNRRVRSDKALAKGIRDKVAGVAEGFTAREGYALPKQKQWTSRKIAEVTRYAAAIARFERQDVKVYRARDPQKLEEAKRVFHAGADLPKFKAAFVPMYEGDRLEWHGPGKHTPTIVRKGIEKMVITWDMLGLTRLQAVENPAEAVNRMQAFVERYLPGSEYYTILADQFEAGTRQAFVGRKIDNTPSSLLGILNRMMKAYGADGNGSAYEWFNGFVAYRFQPRSNKHLYEKERNQMLKQRDAQREEYRKEQRKLKRLSKRQRQQMGR